MSEPDAALQRELVVLAREYNVGLQTMGTLFSRYSYCSDSESSVAGLTMLLYNWLLSVDLEVNYIWVRQESTFNIREY